jgi:WD40 repeat protein
MCSGINSRRIQNVRSGVDDSLSTPLDNVVGTDGSYVRRVAAEADGPLAAAIAQDGTLRVWNMSGISAPALDATIRSGVAAIALSSRNRLLAGACADRGVCLWGLANPRHPVLAGRWRMPSGAKMGFTSMGISPDGKLLAAASKYGFTLVWSIADPSRPRLIADLPNPTSRDDGTLAAVAFAPRGHILAETIAGGMTRLWSIADPARLVLLATIKAGYSSIAFDPASSLLAAVGDTNIGIWQIEEPRHPERLQVDEQDVSDETWWRRRSALTATIWRSPGWTRTTP